MMKWSTLLQRKSCQLFALLTLLTSRLCSKKRFSGTMVFIWEFCRHIMKTMVFNFVIFLPFISQKHICFSMTLTKIPWLSRPGNWNHKFHDFPGFPWRVWTLNCAKLISPYPLTVNPPWGPVFNELACNGTAIGKPPEVRACWKVKLKKIQQQFSKGLCTSKQE